jgi:hypothetical protein
MTINTIDESQRKAARLAGFTYLFAFPFVLFANFAIYQRLIVAGNATETAQNILANQTLFRIGFVCELIYSAGFVVVLAALYVILKPVHRSLALIGAFLRLVFAFMWIRATLNLFDALRILNGADYLRVFETAQLQALARLYISERFDQYYVGLLFWALASTVCSYLWFKSSYIPRTLSAFGMISSVWCAACTFALIIFPNFDNIVNLWWFDFPMAVFEIVVSFWLLFKGLSPSEITEPGKVSDQAQIGGA